MLPMSATRSFSPCSNNICFHPPWNACVISLNLMSSRIPRSPLLYPNLRVSLVTSLPNCRRRRWQPDWIVPRSCDVSSWFISAMLLLIVTPIDSTGTYKLAYWVIRTAWFAEMLLTIEVSFAVHCCVPVNSLLSINMKLDTKKHFEICFYSDHIQPWFVVQ